MGFVAVAPPRRHVAAGKRSRYLRRLVPRSQSRAPIAIPADTFLVPVRITGAVGLQNWQFDLLFDNTVVEHVDPLDGSSGICGAEFTPGVANSLSFILGGFPFNALGLIDDVA